MKCRFIKSISKISFAVMLSAVCLCTSACGQLSFMGNGSSGTEQVIYPDTTDAEPLTIGYTFWDLPIDGFIVDQANQIKLTAEALNVNLIFNPDVSDLSATGVITAAERYAEQGVDGMIVINFSDESLIDISKTCEDAKIPFIQATRTINDIKVAEVVEKNPYYVGRIHESEYAAAYEVGRKLIDTGAKNIVMLCPEHGDAAYESRADGFRDACEEPDVNIIEEKWGLADDSEAVEGATEILKKHPEADGIFLIRCGYVPFVVEAEDAMGIDKYIPMVGVDFDKSLGTYIENGAVLAAAGGHHADASLSLIALVNAIRGSYDGQTEPVDINYNMMVIDSPTAFYDYRKWCLNYDDDFENGQILNPNDARGLCVDYNPDTTINDIISFAENMSLEAVKDRHKGFVKQK